MEEQERIHYELLFSKCREARFLSHSDVMRLLARSLRRTGLPIYFSQGFNPKPKVSYLTQPLSPGHTSECERMRFSLVKPVESEEVIERVAAAFPPGIRMDSVSLIPPQTPKKDASSYIYYVYFQTPEAKQWGYIPTEIEKAFDENLLDRLDDESALSSGILENKSASEAYIKSSFCCAACLTIFLGDRYRRPDECVKECAGTDMLFFLHRFSEVFSK